MDTTPGERFHSIRKALGLTQAQMAHRLTQQAGALALDLLYDTAIVSKIEQGVRKLGLEDGVVVAALDPQQRGVRWLVTGEADVATLPAIPVPTHGRRGRPATAKELGLETETPASKKKAGGRN